MYVYVCFGQKWFDLEIQQRIICFRNPENITGINGCFTQFVIHQLATRIVCHS